MRLLRTAARAGAGLLAAAVIAFLLVNARSIDPAAHSSVIGNLSKIQELDSELDEIVLKLRDGLLHTYDPLVAALGLIHAHHRDLEAGEHAVAGRGEAEVDAALAQLDVALAEKEALIERFKSRNALLRNSFHYFPTSVDVMSRDAQTPPELRVSAQALLRDMLMLRLGATPLDYKLISLEIDQLRRRQPRSAFAGEKLESVVLHARFVLEHQAALDGLVRDITATGLSRTGRSLSEAYNRAFEQRLRQANLYRFVLILLIVGLLGYAVFSFRRLRRSESRYRKLFDEHPRPMWLYDPHTLAFRTVNEAAIKDYGYSRDEFLSMTLRDIRPQEDVPALLEAIRHPELARRQSWRHRRKDGTLIDVEIASHDFDFSGLAGRLALVENVTAKKQAEQQLQLAARALENAAEGVMIADQRHRIVSVNKAFTRITGYEPAEVIGQESDFLRSSEHDAAFYEKVRSEVRDAGRWQGEILRRRKDGAIYPEWRSISTVRDPAENVTHYVEVFSDISQDKEAQIRLEFMAHHDALTGLPNRILFEDRLQEALNRAHRHRSVAGLLFIDLDRFKDVNDSLGHHMGDQLLREVTARLKACVRETDTVARLGGDEFTLLVEELGEPQHAAQIAEKVLAALAEPLVLGDHQVFISGSIGVSCYPQDGGDAQILLKNADAAMYQAKERGRNNFQFFSAAMNARALDRLVMKNSLRAALERGELLLHYQPIVDLGSGRLNAVEALLRWRHPEQGLVAPLRFIPLAEESGLIVPIGEWVLRTACAQMKAWQDAGIAPRRMAVNLSARQFRQKHLLQHIEEILRATGLEPKYLELEITESMVMEDPGEAVKLLGQLSDLGVTLAIDDFGTGYSSLSYLKRFPVDFLKIDRSFVREVPQNADDVAIARTIIALARGLGLRVIAEGVETERQRNFLEMEGCEEAQGYLLGKPAEAQDVERLLREPYAR